MDKRVKISGIISAIMGFISFCWLIYDFIALEYLKPKILNFEPLGRLGEILGAFVWIGFLVIFLFHVSAIIAILFQFQFFKKSSVLRIMTLCLGILSLFVLMGDYSMLNDIGKECEMGLEIKGELIILYIFLFIHGLFHMFMFVLLFHTFRHSQDEDKSENAKKDEIIFTIAQFIGIFCGLMGLWINFSYIERQIPPHNLIFLVPFYCLILMPYGLTVSYWLMMKLKERPSDWYDEKQWKDITKAALTTLILSIPGLSILFFIKHPIKVYWFPHYLFLILFLFSGSILFFNKK